MTVSLFRFEEKERASRSVQETKHEAKLTRGSSQRFFEVFQNRPQIGIHFNASPGLKDFQDLLADEQAQSRCQDGRDA